MSTNTNEFRGFTCASVIVEEVRYVESAKLLSVRLRTGQTYHYVDVPRSAYYGFMEAKSKGTFYQAVIVEDYDCEKQVEETDAPETSEATEA